MHPDTMFSNKIQRLLNLMLFHHAWKSLVTTCGGHMAKMFGILKKKTNKPKPYFCCIQSQREWLLHLTESKTHIPPISPEASWPMGEQQADWPAPFSSHIWANWSARFAWRSARRLGCGKENALFMEGKKTCRMGQLKKIRGSRNATKV